MTPLTIIWSVLAVTANVAIAADSPLYVIVAPSKIRPFSEYVVAVNIYESAENKPEKSPVTVDVKIHGTEPNNGFERKTSLPVEFGKTARAKFEIEDLKAGNYNLTVACDSLGFSNTTELDVAEKYQSIFVQTDKAMYKPGNKVQFRVLVLDPYLKPSKFKKIDVVLKDGQNNIVKEWKDVEAPKGVFSSDIQLSAYPVLGDWTIVVKTAGGERSKTFTVAEYVLPKFEVIVEAPAHATFKKPKVPITIKAKYTFGQLVKGEATITTSNDNNYYSEEQVKPTTKTIKVDNVGETVIDVVEALGLNTSSGNRFYERGVKFDVSFKEELTGKILNGSAKTSLHDLECQLHFVSQDQHLIPGQPFKATLKVTDWDDKPYKANGDEPVKIKYGSDWQDLQNATWQDYTLPSNGLLPLEIPIEADKEMIQIEAEYGGASSYTSASKKNSNRGGYQEDITIDLTDENAKIGGSLDATVSIKGKPKYIDCFVMGRNELVHSKSVRYDDNASIVNVSFPITQSMAPASDLIISYIDEKGEFLAKSRYINVKNAMDNFVKLSASPNETEPGKEAVINVETRSNSFVGLMGIDQSVILLKKGNDLSKDDVENDLRSYSQRGWQYRHKRVPWSYAPSAESEFNNAGAVMFTNAYIRRQEFFHYPAAPAAAFSPSSGSPGSPGLAGNPGPPQNAVTVRSKFPETWIWNTVESGFVLSVCCSFLVIGLFLRYFFSRILPSYSEVQDYNTNPPWIKMERILISSKHEFLLDGCVLDF
ncbi:thioester-containing protein [Nesidiocoris tenuis]|uniref:Thioester-containing protein n=1 Tax=Nesidiocoris tenuis TaxID=355587 RepID=A0ABN7BFF7_9HEMI|nr:thioester-containing protein [Nesidiocoris tenuis]